MSKFIFDEESKLEFQNIVEGIVSEYNSVIDDLSLNIREVYGHTKYEKLGIFANNFFAAYNEDILGVIVPNAVDVWLDSQASFKAYAQKMSVGENAEQFSKSIDAIVRDTLSEFKKIEAIELATDGEIDISVSDFMKISNSVKVAVRESDKIGEEYNAKIETYIENNNAASTLRPVLGFIPRVVSTFNSALDKAFEAFSANFETRLKQQEEAILQATSDLETMAASAMNNVSNSEDGSYADISGIAGLGALGGTYNGSGVSSGSGSSGGNKKKTTHCFKELKKYADLHMSNINPNNTTGLFRYVNDSVFGELGGKHTKFPYEIVKQLMPIFEDYYSSLGDKIEWHLSSRGGCSTREAHAKQEYIGVLTERDNFKYFSEEDKKTFLDGCDKDYKVFSTVARATSSICDALVKKTSGTFDMNLIYALYVFTEVSDTTSLKICDEYDQFSTRTANRIYEIIGESPQVTKGSGTSTNCNEQVNIEPKDAFEKLLKDSVETKIKLNELEKCLLANANQIKAFHKEHSDGILTLLRQMGSNVLSNPELLLNGESNVTETQTDRNSDFPVSERAITIMKEYVNKVQNLEQLIEERIQKRSSSQKDSLELGKTITKGIGGQIIKSMGGLLSFIPYVGESVGSVIGEVADPITEQLFKKAFESADCKRVFDKKLIKELSLIFGSEYMPIVNSYLCYQFYKNEPAEFNKALNQGYVTKYNYEYVSDYIYTPDVDRDLADKLNLMGNVHYYCHIKKCFNWTNRYPINNAIGIQANKAILMILGVEESKCDLLFKNIISKYKWPNPKLGIKMEDYYIG